MPGPPVRSAMGEQARTATGGPTQPFSELHAVTRILRVTFLTPGPDDAAWPENRNRGLEGEGGEKKKKKEQRALMPEQPDGTRKKRDGRGRPKRAEEGRRGPRLPGAAGEAHQGGRETNGPLPNRPGAPGAPGAPGVPGVPGAPGGHRVDEAPWARVRPVPPSASGAGSTPLISYGSWRGGAAARARAGRT